MRKIYVMLWLLLPGAVTTGQAQRVVRGTVQVAPEKGPLPGVTVLLKGTKTGVSTDTQGNFQLISLRDTVTLLFSFVGFETLEKKVIVTQDTTMLPPIRLKERCIIDFFYSRHVDISLLSGLRYTPMGGKIKVFYPYLMHIRHGQGHVRAEFGYQLGNTNYQRNGTLALDNAFIDCDNNVDITTDYQSVKLGEQGFSYARYTAGATYAGRLVSQAVPVYLAVGMLRYSVEGVSATKAGVETGINHPFFIYLNSARTKSIQLIATGRIAYWQDYWQFQSSTEAQFNRFSIGVNFSKLGQYAEINTRVGFRIERRYHAKKPLNQETID